MYCEYCHDIAVMFCVNEECDGYRKSACKSCAVTQNCRCETCGRVAGGR